MGEGGCGYSRVRTRDSDQDLGEMKDQGSGGVTPSPAEGEISLAHVRCTLLAVQFLMDLIAFI